MALGVLIGAAVASRVAKSAYNMYQAAKAANPESGITLDSVRESAVNKLNKIFGEEKDSNAGKANAVQNSSPAVCTEYEFEQAKEIFCEYCDGMIVLGQGVTNCPHCGGTIRKGQTRLVVKRQIQRTQQVRVAQPQHVPGYYFICYNCGTNVRYVAADILRSPSANRVVKERGYRGHTGEVRCPRCGAFLPHYENNWRN